MENQTISITLGITEWNVVMQALGNMPFAQVSNIIPSIQKQANEQIKPAEPAAE